MEKYDVEEFDKIKDNYIGREFAISMPFLKIRGKILERRNSKFNPYLKMYGRLKGKNYNGVIFNPSCNYYQFLDLKRMKKHYKLDNVQIVILDEASN